jgi:hypothetical protein
MTTTTQTLEIYQNVVDSGGITIPQSQLVNYLGYTYDQAASNSNGVLLTFASPADVTKFTNNYGDFPNNSVVGTLENPLADYSSLTYRVRFPDGVDQIVNTANWETDAIGMSPTPKNNGDTQVSGGVTTSGLARGAIANTTIDKINNSLSHMCDFSTEVKKDNALKKFLTSIANQVRDAIKQIKIALGADPTGQLSWVASMLNKIKRILDWINKEIVQPIINFEKLVIGYIQKIQAIISWILSLPARLAQMLADCLKALYKLIANTFTDLESSSGGLSTDLLSTAKSVVSSASSLYSATSLAVTNASTITMTTLNAATVQPTSAVTAASAAAAIVDYTSTLPSSDTVANNVASDTKPNTSMP